MLPERIGRSGLGEGLAALFGELEVIDIIRLMFTVEKSPGCWKLAFCISFCA